MFRRTFLYLRLGGKPAVVLQAQQRVVVVLLLRPLLLLLLAAPADPVRQTPQPSHPVSICSVLTLKYPANLAPMLAITMVRETAPETRRHNAVACQCSVQRLYPELLWRCMLRQVLVKRSLAMAAELTPPAWTH